jgi:hypothetical protein
MFYKWSTSITLHFLEVAQRQTGSTDPPRFAFAQNQ